VVLPLAASSAGRQRSRSIAFFPAASREGTRSLLVCFSLLQVLSALDILQPPHLDFFQEMYPF